MINEEDKYKKYWTRPNKDILAEVLDKTIELDYLINRIVRDYFGLDVQFDENNNVKNMEKLSNFSDFFSLDMGANKKLKIINKLRKELSGEEKMKIENFDNKFLRIYEIRNIFAHSKLPKKTDKKWLANPEEISWEEIHKEHDMLCDEIIPALMADF